MSKTIKTILLISVLLFALLQSASGRKLRSLDEESFNLEDATDTAPENDNSDNFELGEGSSTESPPETTDHAANYDLGDLDSSSAPAPTTTEESLGAANRNGDTSFVLGDDNETPTVTNTQNNEVVGTAAESFELKEDDETSKPVGADADGESFELKEDDDTSIPVGAAAVSTEDNSDNSFELEDKEEDNVDLTDPADVSSSTDKSSDANNNGNGRALYSSADLTASTSLRNANAGVSLQTGIVMTLVAVVSALVL